MAFTRGVKPCRLLEEIFLEDFPRNHKSVEQEWGARLVSLMNEPVPRSSTRVPIWLKTLILSASSVLRSEVVGETGGVKPLVYQQWQLRYVTLVKRVNTTAFKQQILPHFIKYNMFFLKIWKSGGGRKGDGDNSTIIS